MGIDDYGEVDNDFKIYYPTIMEDLDDIASVGRENGAWVKRARETISGLSRLNENIQEIASIENEDVRNTKILKITKLSAEKGFCSGKKVEDRVINIKDKIKLLLDSYIYFKESDKLEEYFKNAFVSDPCFNGRIAKLTNYVATEQHHIPSEALSDAKVEPKLAMKYYNLVEANFEEMPSREEFKSFFRKQKNYQSDYKELIESDQFEKVYNYIKSAFID